MPTKLDLDYYRTTILNPYTQLMEEIKRRQAVIDTICRHSIPLPAIVATELCYLQLRFICELIALGCLVAHGDIQATRGGKLRKIWAADRIINTLEELHPDFYPQPGKQVLGPNGRPLRIDPITDGFLSKADLVRLNHECGGLLHRGAIKGVFSATQRQPDLDRVTLWSRKIVRLLNHHEIQLINSDLMIWALMQGESDGRVQATLFARDNPASPDKPWGGLAAR